MEPDDMPPDDLPIHDLLGVGDGADPGPDPLRAIVARARRHRWRVAAGGMAVALAVGGALGYAFSNHSSTAAQTSAGAQTSTGSGPTTSGAGAAISSAAGGVSSGANIAAAPGALFPVGATGPLTHLFTRTTGGDVTVRVFRTEAMTPAALPASCMVSLPQIQVDVSTAAMVGITIGSAPATHSKPVTAVEVEMVGQAEGDPTAVVMVATGPTVTQTRVSFKGGATDSMAPVGGWAVLAGSAPAHPSSGAAIGTLTAMDAAGRVVGSSSLTMNTFPPFAVPGASCSFTCPESAGSAAKPAGTAGSPITCTSYPCGRVLPGRVPPVAGTAPVGPPPVTAPATPPLYHGTFVCATGGSGASSGASGSNTGSTGNKSAAG